MALGKTCSKEIKRRLALGRVALRKLDKIWKSNDVSIGTKRRLVQALVFPVVMYGAETWTVLKTDRKKIDAFELWCWRRILKVPWTKKITNKEILEKIQPEYRLEAMIIKLKLGYVGHVLRKPTSMENSIMLGKTEGTPEKGSTPYQMDGWCEGSSWDEAWTVEGRGQRSETLEKSDYGSHQETHADRRNLMMMRPYCRCACVTDWRSASRQTGFPRF